MGEMFEKMSSEALGPAGHFLLVTLYRGGGREFRVRRYGAAAQSRLLALVMALECAGCGELMRAPTDFLGSLTESRRRRRPRRQMAGFVSMVSHLR